VRKKAEIETEREGRKKAREEGRKRERGSVLTSLIALI
jgi:hypothetical protein